MAAFNFVPNKNSPGLCATAISDSKTDILSAAQEAIFAEPRASERGRSDILVNRVFALALGIIRGE